MYGNSHVRNYHATRHDARHSLHFTACVHHKAFGCTTLQRHYRIDRSISCSIDFYISTLSSVHISITQFRVQSIRSHNDDCVTPFWRNPRLLLNATAKLAYISLWESAMMINRIPKAGSTCHIRQNFNHVYFQMVFHFKPTDNFLVCHDVMHNQSLVSCMPSYHNRSWRVRRIIVCVINACQLQLAHSPQPICRVYHHCNVKLW